MSLTDVLIHLDKEDGSLIRIIPSSSSNDGIDERYLIVGQTTKENQLTVKRYVYNGKNIEKRWISKDYLVKSATTGSNRQMTQWILAGEILHDPMNFIQTLREELSDKSSLSYRRKMYIEFAGFVSTYSEAKGYLKSGQQLSAFNSMLQSLYHWARLAILEAGEHPEVTVWEQVKHIDPSVYKLHEEFVTSKEPLDKRVELLLLATEFSVLSRMETCVQLIIDILRSKAQAWTVDEILNHPNMGDPTVDIYPLLEKMAKRNLVKEGTVIKDGLYEKCYSATR
jgi:hypothetical protein